MRQFRLSRLLFFRSVLVATVTFAVVFVMMTRWLLPQIDNDTIVRQHQLAHAIASEVEAQLANPASAIRHMMRLLTSGEPRLSGGISRMLDEVVEEEPSLAAVYALSDDGSVAAVGLRPERRGMRADLLGTDFSAHPVFDLASRGGGVRWANATLSPAGEGVVAVVALREGGLTLVGELATTALMAAVHEVADERGLRTMLLDARGNVVGDTSGHNVAMFDRLAESERGARAHDDGSAFARVRIDGVEMIGSLVPVMPLGWNVLVVRPEAEAFRPSRTAELIMLVGLAISVMVGLFGAAVQAGYFARLFRELSVFAVGVEQGRYELSWRPTRVREFNRLAGAFGRMSRAIHEREAAIIASQAALQELNQNLEARVAERTEALERSNAELSAALDNLRRTQEELVNSEKMAALGALVAGVAHELGTPMGNALIAANTVRDQTRGLKRELEGGLRRSALERYLDDTETANAIIERNLERAAQLVASFKQVAVDQSSAQRREFSLGEVVDEIVMTLRPSLKRLPYRMAVDVDRTVRLDSYPGALGQVLANLINNAVLHGFEGLHDGEIRIEGCLEGPDSVLLEVVDDGRGIPLELQRKIFEPFFTSRLGKGGSGLGLHIVHSLVTNVLGGSVSVDSQPGVGTRMRIRLPRQAPHASGAPASAIVPEAGGAA